MKTKSLIKLSDDVLRLSFLVREQAITPMKVINPVITPVLKIYHIINFFIITNTHSNITEIYKTLGWIKRIQFYIISYLKQ